MYFPFLLYLHNNHVKGASIIVFYIVDRIESGFAICEASDLSVVNIPIGALPSGVCEGACLSYDGVCYKLELLDEAARRERVRRKLDLLFRKDK